MGDEDGTPPKTGLIQRLEGLGLTEYEAKTLIALVRLGTGTAKDVAETDGVPRTRVYDAVETLHEMGLVDVQHTTPRKYTVISRESIVRKLDLERERRIAEIEELLQSLDSAEPETEQFGTWTVTGHEAVKQRVLEFVDEAEEQFVYLTVDELLTDAHLDRLRDAEDRGVDVYVGGVSDRVEERITAALPSATVFETLWEWADTPAGSLLITDERTALVSVRVAGPGSGDVKEVAIWGEGERNSLVVVLRAIFTWRLESYEEAGPADEEGTA